MLFSYGPKGKPGLAPEFLKAVPQAGDLRFNLSHAGGLALYGFTRGRDIGVDIEQIRALEDAEQIARRFFAPGKCRWFCAPPPSRMQGFSIAGAKNPTSRRPEMDSVCRWIGLKCP